MNKKVVCGSRIYEKGTEIFPVGEPTAGPRKFTFPDNHQWHMSAIDYQSETIGEENNAMLWRPKQVEDSAEKVAELVERKKGLQFDLEKIKDLQEKPSNHTFIKNDFIAVTLTKDQLLKHLEMLKTDIFSEIAQINKELDQLIK